MDKITLDREVFKALASDTRLDILKALDERQKTVTELAKQLDLNKATVFEHLEKLAAVGLIQKLEDDARKWVYWQLSWTGRRLLHPEKITLAVLLSTALGTLLTAMAVGWLWLRSNVSAAGEALGLPAAGDARIAQDAESGSAAAPRSALSADAPPPSDADATAAAVQHDPTLLAAAVVLGLVVLALVGWAVLVWRRARAAETAEATAA